MSERDCAMESQLETDMRQNDTCLLAGELSSLYVDDVSTAALTNGRHCCLFVIKFFC